MHNRYMVLTVIGLVSAYAGAAAAQSDAAGRSPDMDIVQGEAPALKIRETRFRFLDIDGDGFISRREVPDDDAQLSSQFASLDADGDGRLSRTEFVLSHRAAIE